MAEDKVQRFTSQYGQKPITVPAETPTYAIGRVLSRTHVGTPHEEVEAMVRDNVAKRRAQGMTEWTPKMENAAVKYAHWQHEENRLGYARVMGPSYGHPYSPPGRPRG